MSARLPVLLATSNGVGMGHLTRQLTVALSAPDDIDPVLMSLSGALPTVRSAVASGALPELAGVRTEYCPSRKSGWLPKGGAARRLRELHPAYNWEPYFADRLRALVAETGARLVLFDGVVPYAGLLAARILAHILGIPEATDEEMIFWSQALIDGAGNFGWQAEPFAVSDRANAEMDALFARCVERVRAEPDRSALSVMVNAENPIPMSQIYANIKIAIGGGINEPRDALSTIVYGLLTEPEQLEEVRRTGKWGQAFEEGVRWVAPIQASSRLVMEDVEIRGCLIPKGDTVMTIQASANHDEDLYDHPERFDVFRAKNPHQSFGSGPHHCGGVHISRRTVGAVMLELLFERFPAIALPDPEVVQWRGFGFRGPINLPVILN